MASAQNYVNSLRQPQQGGYQEPSFGRVAPPPVDTYDGGFSASNSPGGFGSEYANDPNAPSWLKETPSSGQPSSFDPMSREPQPLPHKQGCCDKLGPKFFSILTYLFGIIGGIIGVLIEKKDAYILANAWQSIFVGIPCIIICILFSWAPGIVISILWAAYWAICIALAIACAIVPYPRIFHLPFCIGNWAIKRAQSTVATHAYRTQHHTTVTETTTLTSNVYV